MAEQKPYKVLYGYIGLDEHIMSRDVAPNEFFDTPQQVNSFLQETQARYKQLGGKLWAVSIHELVGEEYIKINKGNEPHIDISK